MAMIETVGLTKHFGEFAAVSDVSLSVNPGQVLALLGPNGAGKTTTVRMLAAILTPTAGSAHVAGYDVVRQADNVRSAVGVLTEHHGLYLRMRAREYLEFYGQLHQLERSVREKRASQLMERFGLSAEMDRRLGEFSKGMRQKLALVRAMLHDPEVLLLDEPTSAMDPHSAKLVRDAISGLRGDGRTIIICTHNLPEAEMLADRIAIIRRGRIVAEGTPLELKARLLGPPLLELRLASRLDGLVDNITDMVQVESHGYDWVRFRVETPQKTNPLLLRRLSEQGADVVTLSEVPQSLEDVYLRVVNAGPDGEPLNG
jgi:ABC-2 type transport system ATP-binding protein